MKKISVTSLAFSLRCALLLLALGGVFMIASASLYAATFSHEIKLFGDNANKDQLGISTAVNGNILVVGAPKDNSKGKNSGSAYVYTRRDASSTWQLSQKLMLQQAHTDQSFGVAVATNGQVIIVGAPGDNEHGRFSGAAYVFSRSSGQSDPWQVSAKLIAEDATAEDRFGASIAIDEQTVIIGAPIKDKPDAQSHKVIPAASKNQNFIQQGFVFLAEGITDSGTAAGAAYVFAYNPDSTVPWKQTAKLLGKTVESGDTFGHAVSISGNMAVVGAYNNDILDNIGAGSAHVFNRNPDSDTWHETVELQASDQFVDDHFGSSVAINANTIAIGAYQRDENGFNTGKVYIYSHQNSEWSETAQLIPEDSKSQDHFGSSMAISGQQLVVTGYNPHRPGNGFAYLYEQSAEGWHLLSQKRPGNDTNSGFYGTSVAIHADTIAVGAIQEDGPGSLYLYSQTQTSLPTPTLNNITPKRGLWWNPMRPGHGMDIQRVGDNLFILWYTYREDRTPIWYLASAPFSPTDSNWSADLDLYHFNGQTATSVKAGSIQLNLSSETQATVSWQVQGQAGSEPVEYFLASPEPPPVNYTGTWFDPAQPGYGLTILTQGLVESTVLYFYDSNGTPTWALGSKPAGETDTYSLDSYSGFCPSCPYQETTTQTAGNMSLRFTSPFKAQLSTDLVLQTPLSGNWLLNNINIENFTWTLDPDVGARTVSDRKAFELLANPRDVPGAIGVQEVKFLLVDVDQPQPELYLINASGDGDLTYHYDFARNVLQKYPGSNYRQGLGRFMSETYFSSDRRMLAGSIISHDHYQLNEQTSPGIYTLEFWPTDPVAFHFINQAYRALSGAMPFTGERLVYHPTSDTQELLYKDNLAHYQSNQIPAILTENLYAQTNRATLNRGEAYGRLRIVTPADPPPSIQDIVIYTYVPNDLAHVAGIITETPQTPLSHINLKARQNNTPNAYIKQASTSTELAPLINQWVHYHVSREGISITAATQAQADQWFEQIRPAETQIPKADLSVTEPARLTAIGHKQWPQFGVKAANVAELAKILPLGTVPDGYAIPFALYEQFMRLPRCGEKLLDLCNNETMRVSLYQQAQSMLAEPMFQQNAAIRTTRLKAFRKAIRKAEAPADMIATLEAIRLFWQPEGSPFTQSLRVRSSTNNEDLPGFNGAGLYSSYTHKSDEGELINSIQQVWASLWTDRAFEERRFYRIDHFKTYMGVLVHPNFGDEQANGVAVSKNIYNPNWEGYYANVQHGEISITNPEPIETDKGLTTPIPDEFVITRLPASATRLDWETQFIRHSNVDRVYDQPIPPGNVLSDTEIIQLRNALNAIHRHFKAVYSGDDQFAMEIEFKITETNDGHRGKLAIKQARPWVD